MFACRWFRAFAVLSSVANAATEEVLPRCGLSQEEAETILNVQSNLRRELISSLADVGERISRLEKFHSVLNGIIQDLESKNLDPFKLFKSGVFQGQTPSAVAETIYNLQGPTTLTDWKSLLQTIPDFLPFQPSVQLSAEHMEKIHRTGEPFVAVVLTAIQKNHIKLNGRLLGDVLHNYHFGDDSPDTIIISDNLNRMLEGHPVNFSDFHPDPSAKGPDAILSDILKYVAGKSDSEVAQQIAQLLPALSDRRNVLPVDTNPQRLFDLMIEDDYPADIVQAKNALSSAVGNNRTGLDLSGIAGGRAPMEKLLMLIAKLTSLPGRTSLRKKVQAVYPHVKLRYLAGRGKFFRPRTASDVGFLLDSFLTSPNESNPTLFREIRKVFADFNWEEGLKNFDYSRYSKPRPLVTDMFEELLNNSNKLPVCGVILLGYFLRRNHHYARIDDFFGDFPTEGSKESYTTATAPVKRCPDGPPVRVIDPESIIEAMSPNHHSDFISDLIRFKPIGYATGRRADVFRGVLKGLKSNEGDIIEKILQEVPLNEKADLPPRYVNLCRYELAAMEARRQNPTSLTSTVTDPPSAITGTIPLFSPITPLRSDEPSTGRAISRFPLLPSVTSPNSSLTSLPSAAATGDYSEAPLTTCNPDADSWTSKEGIVSPTEGPSTPSTAEETTQQESVTEHQTDFLSASTTTEPLPTESEQTTTPEDENEWLTNSSAGTTDLGT